MPRFMNNVKTTMLLAGLMALFVVVGRQIGGPNGMILALILGGAMNIAAYFFSDKLAVAMMRAKPVNESDAPEIYSIVRHLSQRADLPMPKVYIAPAETPNAFATGRNPNNALVCLTEGIINQLNRSELTAVIAHELAHIKHRDILISSIAATIAGAITALGYMLWFIPIGGGGRGRGNLLATLAIIILAPIGAMLIQLAISRKREFNADSYGAEIAGSPMPLAIALEKLQAGNRRKPMQLAMPSQSNMFIVAPFSGKKVANLFNTHPPVKKRVRALIGQDYTGAVPMAGQERDNLIH